MSATETITHIYAGSFENYKSEGDVLFKHGEYKKALQSYSVALELREGDKNCLVCRSQCYLQLGDADRGLADAVKTLEDDKNYIKGILQQAESYYQKGEFEYALMHYHRGHKLRPEKQAFRLGIQKSQEAIDNSIGDAAGIKLTKSGDLSYFYEEQQKAAKSQQQQKRVGYTRPGSRERKKQQKRRKEGQDQKTVKQLLGDLYADKEYLEQLLKETESAGNQSETNKDVHTLAEDCLNYLDTRTAFWQQQKPMYSRKNDKKQKEKIKKAVKKDIGDWILMRLSKIDDAQAEGKYEESLSLSKKTLKQVDKLSDDDLPNRPEVVANLHSCHGNAYLELGEYGKALQHHTTDNEIGKQHGIEESKSRSLDNIGRVYARMGHYEKAIEVWEQKVPMVKSSLESTWLNHEIGRCHLELKNYETAKDFGQKSLDAADAAGDEVWQLNATVLKAQCEVKSKDFQAAVDSFEKALEMSKIQGDKAAESAIRKAIEDVNQRIVEDIKEQDEDDVKKDTSEDETKAIKDVSSDKDFERENTVETQVSKEKRKDEASAINQQDSANGDTNNDAKNGNLESEPLERDGSFWNKYNDAVDDKVKFGEIKHEEEAKQKRRRQQYGYPSSMVNSKSNETGSDVKVNTSSKGFSKEYDYDFEGTRSKFESSNETDDEGTKKGEKETNNTEEPPESLEQSKEKSDVDEETK